LAYAHACGVVHRDVKPDNILLDRDSGRAMVTDFGIARAAESGSRLTQTGIAVGTPAFMSPEQATGDKEVDGRSDLYSLGVVGYLMLAGRLPFEATTTPAMLVKHVSETPPPIMSVRPSAPGSLVAILEKCLNKRPSDRWDSALRCAMRCGACSATGRCHARWSSRASSAYAAARMSLEYPTRPVIAPKTGRRAACSSPRPRHASCLHPVSCPDAQLSATVAACRQGRSARVEECGATHSKTGDTP
jgi:serine/threonine protein kinase